jgi:hypothetical protein
LPVAWRLYLPKDWSEDEARRDKAGVPKDVGFASLRLRTAAALLRNLPRCPR